MLQCNPVFALQNTNNVALHASHRRLIRSCFLFQYGVTQIEYTCLWLLSLATYLRTRLLENSHVQTCGQGQSSKSRNFFVHAHGFEDAIQYTTTLLYYETIWCDWGGSPWTYRAIYLCMYMIHMCIQLAVQGDMRRIWERDNHYNIYEINL